MNRVIEPKKKYIVEAKVDEWDGRIVRAIVRFYWRIKVNHMTEGEIMKLEQEIIKENKPLAWLNGGEN